MVHAEEGKAESAFLPEPRRYWLRQPQAEGGACTAIVLFDGERLFHGAVATAEALEGERPALRLAVLGIDNGGNSRTDDLTFSPGPAVGPFAGTGGKAEKFAWFVREELVPGLPARLQRPCPRVIYAGHSLGGLFALELRAKYPDDPAAVLALDPSLWWCPEEWKPPLRTDGLFLALATAPQKGVYAAAQRPLTKAFKMRYPAQVHLYPQDTHSTIFDAAFADGLRALL